METNELLYACRSHAEWIELRAGDSSTIFICSKFSREIIRCVIFPDSMCTSACETKIIIIKWCYLSLQLRFVFAEQAPEESRHVFNAFLNSCSEFNIWTYQALNSIYAPALLRWTWLDKMTLVSFTYFFATEFRYRAVQTVIIFGCIRSKKQPIQLNN